jgi:hypothetical protein
MRRHAGTKVGRFWRAIFSRKPFDELGVYRTGQRLRAVWHPPAAILLEVLLAFVGNILSLPLHFEANRSQTDARVKFLVRNSNSTLFLTRDKAVLSRRTTYLQTKLVKRQARPTAKGSRSFTARARSCLQINIDGVRFYDRAAQSRKGES